jgi:hydrophobe/amphiphile efflux-1 (HAE1) family protein
MALNISAWSIKKPLGSVVLMLVLMILGWLSLLKLPITRLPNVDLPVILVIITQFGAAPSELETQVTKPVEDAVSGVAGVRHIASSINDGVSVTNITLGLDADADRALNDVKDAVTRIRSNLPGSITEPQVQRVDVMGLSIVTYAAISPGRTPEQLSWFVDDVVKRALQGVRGVGRVERIGGVDREIVVRLDPDRLDAVGLTAFDVSRRLKGNNIDLAGGRAEIGGRDQSIRTLAGAKTLGELAATMIALPMGGEVRLDDLGSVTDSVAERRTFARLDGEPVVAFSILRSKGASDVTVAAGVEKRIDEIKAQYPDVDLRVIDAPVEFTRGNYESAIHTLFEGAALAVIVVMIFLRDIRATIIAAITLPLAILPTFWALDGLGFSLNMVSLLAITLSTGILVDDAIVEIENIVRHIRMGKSAYRASLEAADEIGLAVIAISLTIVAVFAPASFMNSIAGQFFKQFGITVSVAVLFSLLVARLVTPMLAAYFFKSHGHDEHAAGAALRMYARVLRWSVRNRFITVAVGLLLFVASIYSVRLLPAGFLPFQDTARSLLAVELPSGSVLSETETVTEEIVKRLRSRPEVKSVFVDGGRIPPGNPEVRKASLIINYTPKTDRKLTQRQLEQEIMRDLQDIPDIRYWLLDENGLRAISRVVTGTDPQVVENFAAELATQMKRIPIVTSVVSTAALDRPELRIKPRADLATRLGVSTTGLSETIRVATIGDVGPALAKFDAGDRQVPIRVQLEDIARADRQTLEQLKVPTPRGSAVPLLTITDMQFGQGPISISRFDRERQAKVEADLVGDAALGDANDQINALPVMKSRPPGVSVKESNDAEALQELKEGFATAMTNGLMAVYAVLVLLFGSFLQPITILFSLPLSVGGAILALLLTGRALSMPVFIGILMLMGIVTKNAIMLVDFGLESMAKGANRTDAIIDAGEKRARPIVMTTAAMVAGMLPSALAIGAGGEFRSPMAIAVMGGLIVSTFLSLLFVPAFFTLMDDVGRLLWWAFGRFVGKSEEPHEAEPSHAGPMIDQVEAGWDERSARRVPLPAEGHHG